MPRLSFRYSPLALTESSAAAAEAQTKENNDNFLNGRLSSTNQLNRKLRFEAGAAVPIPCRGSVVRLVFMKLFGTGVLAAISGMHATDPNVASSCAFAAAVNAVACVHYFFIWAIRAQNFGDDSPYEQFMLKVGRFENYKAETANNAEKMCAQELSVDGLRHSDWTCTLVLMLFDLHKLAKYANPDKDPWFTKEVAAFLQVWIVGLGSIGRFFFNECRRDRDGQWPAVGSIDFWGLAIGAWCYLLSLVIWLSTTLNVTGQARIDNDVNVTSIREWDSTAVFVISWVQVGYAFTAIYSIFHLNFLARDLRDFESYAKRGYMPGNQYDPWLSFFKDLMYGSLDVTTKAGLALYVSMRATWF